MPDPVPVVVPQMNPNDEHAVLIRWHVGSGTRVAAGQPLVTLETTKAAFDVEAPCEGFAFFDEEPNRMVAIGATIALISDQPVPPAVWPAVPVAAAEPSEAAGDGERRFTRKALRLMAQSGLTPADFPGQGKVGEGDVERVAKDRSKPTQQRPAHPGARRLEQSPSKMLEVARLGEVYRDAIPSMVTVPVMSDSLQRRLDGLARDIGAISVLELVIHDAARVLADYPEMNGYYADGAAWHHETVAIGFAINLGKSLRVPVVRGAAELSQLEIARKVRDLSLRYMRGELTMDDVTGGTFTVTDLSGHGVVHFVPVLNEKQAAILGICAERPGTGHRDLVLTFDHRMADGMRAAAFLGDLKASLEAVAAD